MRTCKVTDQGMKNIWTSNGRYLSFKGEQCNNVIHVTVKYMDKSWAGINIKCLELMPKMPINSEMTIYF